VIDEMASVINDLIIGPEEYEVDVRLFRRFPRPPLLDVCLKVMVKTQESLARTVNMLNSSYSNKGVSRRVLSKEC
jgi:hypothetical protein